MQWQTLRLHNACPDDAAKQKLYPFRDTAFLNAYSLNFIASLQKTILINGKSPF